MKIGRLANIRALLRSATSSTPLKIGASLGLLGGGVVGLQEIQKQAELARKAREDEWQAWINSRDRSRRLAYERQSLEASIARNEEIIAQIAPHAYMQMMTGHRLPKGAVVLGGTPRHDIVRELAMGMSDGSFTSEASLRSADALAYLNRMQEGD